MSDLGILAKPIPFGKYYLLEKINTGGMAEVFKAKAFGVEGFERLLAVKKILPSIAEDEEFITMFIDEAKIAVQLNHANIAQIFELGKVDDSYFIALEYVSGRDMRGIYDYAVKNDERLSLPMVCYIIMRLCEGLDYAHNKRDEQGRELQIVHRDISPQNVLISHEGEVKLIDFGIAKAQGKGSQTQVGILKGKFSYMSPEQVRGNRLDRRSDVFSLGIVFYEMLTLQRLFLGSSDFSTLEKIRKVEISPPSLFDTNIPEELENIVLKALARDRNKRYQSAHELQDAIHRFMFNHNLYYTNKDLAQFMRRAFATEISFEQKKLEYYRTLKKEELDRANKKIISDRGLDWDEDEGETNVFDRKMPADEVDLDNIDLPTGQEIIYARPREEEMPARRSSSPFIDLDEEDDDLDAPTQSMNSMRDKYGGKLPDGLPEPPAPRPSSSWDAAPVVAPVPSPAPAPTHSAPHHSMAGGPAIPPPRASGGGKGAIIAVVVVLLLAAGVAVAFFVVPMFNKEEQLPGKLHFKLAPDAKVGASTRITIKIDGVVVAGEKNLPLDIGDIEPTRVHNVVVTSDCCEAFEYQLSVNSGETRTLDINLTPKTAAGYVLSVTPPEASVTIDGSPVATPGGVLKREDLAPGVFVASASAEGYLPAQQSIEAKEGNPTYTLALKPITLALTLDNQDLGDEARATVTVTDATTSTEVYSGALPTTSPIAPVVLGHDYTLSAQVEGLESGMRCEPTTLTWKPTDDVAAQSQALTFECEKQEARDDPRPRTPRDPRRPRDTPSNSDAARGDSGGSSAPARPPADGPPGILRINSKPPADVFINGSPKGSTPIRSLTLPPGNYTVRLVNAEAGIDVTKTVTVESNQTRTFMHQQ